MLKKVFLVHHTHMDIGYTDLPLEVMNQHLGHLDDALKLCRMHDDFFWTIESAYLVRDYLRNRPERCRNELIQALKSGKMELQAFETQPLTELLSADELFRCIEYAADLGQEYKFPINGAMVNDIGGYAGRLPTVLEHYGVKYLTAGVGGFQVHLPWAKLPHLFYLKSKDGARTLIWNLGIDRSLEPQDMTGLCAVYGQAALFLILPAIKEYLNIYERGVEIDFKSDSGETLDTANIFAGFLKRLKRENYPWDEIMLQYGGDNRGPAPFLPELLKKLNQTGKFPEIELTTPSRFFKHMEEKYKDSITEIEGVITDPWNSRANPSPGPLKNYRAAQRIYYGALGRLALNNIARDQYIDELCRTVDDNLMLYGDHTCGLSEWNWMNDFHPDGCRGQAYDRYRESWKAKAFYAATAKDGAIRIDRAIKNRLSPGISNERSAIIVWNDSACPVSGATSIYLGRDAFPLIELRDQNGNNTVFQETASNHYLIEVKDVPPFGKKVLIPVFSEYPGAFVPKNSALPESFENSFFKINFDADGNLISIRDKDSGKEFLDQNSIFSFGEFILQRLNDIPLDGRFAGMKISKESDYPKSEIIENVLIANGPVVVTVSQKGKISTDTGIIRYQRSLRFYNNAPRIEVNIRIDKPETEKKESCYIAFPFADTDGSFKFDQNIGLVDPCRDLLPGSMLDLFYCSRFASVSTDDFTAVIAAPDAPLFQFGGIHTAQWLQKLPLRPQTNHIYGQIYHNLLNTDCPIWQDILESFGYSVWLHPGKFDYSKAQADSNSATSLSASFSNGNNRTDTIPSSFQVSPESVRLLSIRPKNKEVELRLENTHSGSVTAVISLNAQKKVAELRPYQVIKLNF